MKKLYLVLFVGTLGFLYFGLPAIIRHRRAKYANMNDEFEEPWE